MRTLIIHNTVSGTGTDDIFAFERALLRPGDEVVMRAMGGEAGVEGLLADASAFDAVVASGGDGTIASVAYAMRGSDVPVLVFPSGTANLFANNLGNATEPAALAATLRNGKRVNLDLCEFEYTDAAGQTHHKGFLNMAGAGFDAALMQGSEALKGAFGPLSYYLAALGNLNPGIARFSLTLDGRPHEAEGIGVMVGNWATVNPTMEIIPGSCPADGMLDVAILTTKNSLELLPALFGSLFAHGRPDAYPNMEIIHAREVTVRCSPALMMQYDGEVVEGTSASFAARVIEGGFHTIVDDLSPFAHLEA